MIKSQRVSKELKHFSSGTKLHASILKAEARRKRNWARKEEKRIGER